jgi:uncharacterized protein YcfJ
MQMTFRPVRTLSRGALPLVAGAALLLASCNANVDNDTARRAGTGAAVGAVAGGVIGSFSGNWGAGAAAGAAIGGSAGFLYDQIRMDQ